MRRKPKRALIVTSSLLLTIVTAVALAERERPRAPTPPLQVDVTLSARPGGGVERVNFGVPLPPGFLLDAELVQVVDEQGSEIPAAVRVLEPWRADGYPESIRALQIQFDRDFGGKPAQKVAVRFGSARTKDETRFVPVADTLVDPEGKQGPKVAAVLPARWLADSWVGGPHVPAAESGPLSAYDKWVEVNFPGSLKYLDSRIFDHWLYDRPTAYYQMYVRTGDAKFLKAGHEAAHFMRRHTQMTGPLAGMFTVKEEPDLKYVYPRAMHFHYLLTGDERAREAGVIMARLWLSTWNPRYAPGVRPSSSDAFASGWAERYAGYGLLAMVHGWELTGDRAFRDKAREYADALYDHQTRPPDSRPADGSFRTVRRSSGEGFRAGSSPWMTAILLDGLFEYWMLTGDSRVPGMVRRWCDFLDRHGMLPDGSQAYYIIQSPFSDPGAPGSDLGPDMELHNPEMAFMFAMGAYFSDDPARASAYRSRFDTVFRRAVAVDHHQAPDHRRLENRETEPSVRSFNWAFQSSGRLVYFLRHAESASR